MKRVREIKSSLGGKLKCIMNTTLRQWKSMLLTMIPEKQHILGQSGQTGTSLRDVKSMIHYSQEEKRGNYLPGFESWICYQLAATILGKLFKLCIVTI